MAKQWRLQEETKAPKATFLQNTKLQRPKNQKKGQWRCKTYLTPVFFPLFQGGIDRIFFILPMVAMEFLSIISPESVFCVVHLDISRGKTKYQNSWEALLGTPYKIPFDHRAGTLLLLCQYKFGLIKDYWQSFPLIE